VSDIDSARRRSKIRDQRFPPHEDIVDAIYGWAADGEPYTAEEVREGLADALGVSYELQYVEKPKSGIIIWTNLIAHGLAALSRTDPNSGMTQHELIDGEYHLTELGRQMVAKAIGDGMSSKDIEDMIREILTEPGADWI
jgi:hypothetical protein